MPRIASLPTIAMFGLLTSCAQMVAMSDREVPPTTKPSQSAIVGTWRFVRVTAGDNKKAYPWLLPFYCRFYSDGTVATWPTPIAPITRGRYQIDDGCLVLIDPERNVRGQLRISRDTMWLWNDDGDECLYYRVAVDLEPGWML